MLIGLLVVLLWANDAGGKKTVRIFNTPPSIYIVSELDPRTPRKWPISALRATIVPQDVSGVVSYIKEVFGAYSDNALKVATCESNLRPNAIGDHGWSIGVFQIYTRVHTQYTKDQLLDYKFNIEEAHKLFLKRGWAAWTCRYVL